jgi:hypothetical protein
MSQPQEQVSNDEAAAVFRRAAELDLRRQTGETTELDMAALEQAGVEAGLSRDSIRQALAEIKAGSVDVGVRRDAVVTRTLGMDAAALERDVERFMRQQNFRVLRRLEDRTMWVPDRSFAGKIKSVTDFTRRIVLREVTQVTTAVVGVPGSDGKAHVRFELDMGHVRWAWYTLPMTLGATGAAGVVVAAVLGTPLEVILAAPGAVALAGGGYLGARAGMRGSVRRSVNGIERFLDRLERGR